MSDALDRLVERLRLRGANPKQSGRHWYALCPAHDDNTASLSVSPGRDHPVVMQCHAGCDTDDILAALDLRRSDICDDRPRRDGPGVEVARYRYEDWEGRHLYDGIRYEPKNFLVQAANGTWSVPKERRVPYRLPDVRAAIDGGDVIYIAEGEKDCDALMREGVTAATTNPFGAGNWLGQYDHWFEGADEVRIIADRDPKGARHALDVARHLRPIAQTVSLFIAAEGNDPADHFVAGHTLADLVEVTEERLRRVADGTDDEDDDELLADVRNGAWLDSQPFPELRWHVERIIVEGYTLLVGGPKLGKSWFVLAIGLAVASGGRALGLIKVEQRPVLYLALEDSHRRLQDRARKLLGPGQPIPADLHFLTRVSPDKIIDTIRAWLARHHDRQPLVIVDTLGKVCPPALAGETTYQRDYRIGSALKALADDVPGAALIVNHHTRKAGADDFVDAVSGTNGLAGAADSILVLSRRRGESGGSLQVTGRDVDEAEYALTFRQDEAWRLAGDDLDEAATNAAETHMTDGVGDPMARVIGYVSRNPEGVRAADVAKVIGIGDHLARNYLARACKAGRLQKIGRGLYAPVCGASDASDASVANAQVIRLFEDPDERTTSGASDAFDDDDDSDDSEGA